MANPPEIRHCRPFFKALSATRYGSLTDTHDIRRDPGSTEPLHIGSHHPRTKQNAGTQPVLIASLRARVAPVRSHEVGHLLACGNGRWSAGPIGERGGR